MTNDEQQRKSAGEDRMKLSKKQLELLDAIKAGTVVHFMGGLNAYYFRDDTHKTCTATVRVLERMDLLERFNDDWRGYSLRIKR
jgi:hypothetical protein